MLVGLGVPIVTPEGVTDGTRAICAWNRSVGSLIASFTMGMLMVTSHPSRDGETLVVSWCIVTWSCRGDE